MNSWQELVHVNRWEELVRVSNWAHGAVALVAFKPNGDVV